MTDTPEAVRKAALNPLRFVREIMGQKIQPWQAELLAQLHWQNAQRVVTDKRRRERD